MLKHFTVCIKDVGRGFADFTTIYFRRFKYLAMLLILLITGALTAAIFSEHVVDDIPVIVVDRDNSLLSRTLRLFMEADPVLDVLGTTDFEHAQALLRYGKIESIIYFPEETLSGIKSLRGGNIIVYSDGSPLVLTRNSEKELMMLAKVASIGAQMKILKKLGIPKSEIMGLLMPVGFEMEFPYNPTLLYSVYLYPVLLLFVAYLFTILMSNAVFQERITVGFHSLYAFFAGRLFAILIPANVIALFLIYIYFPFAGIFPHSSFGLVVVTNLAMTVTTQILVCAVVSVLRVLPVLAMQISVLVGMMSLPLCGLTFPVESMPWYMQVFSSLLPLNPYLNIMQISLHYTTELRMVWPFMRMFVMQIVIFGGLLLLSECIRLLYKEIRFFIGIGKSAEVENAS